MTTDYTEDALVEQPAIALLDELGWKTANCYHETFGPGGMLDRETSSEVVLVSRLRPALERLNPDLSPQAINLAIEELTRDRSAMSLAGANREVHILLKNGVLVDFRDAAGEDAAERVRVIDWDDPANNDYFLASQLWITGEVYKRRPDLLGFVNGLPLVLLEFKAPHKPLHDAYQDNLRDYKNTIPHLFWYNGLVILSNGSETRVGSLTAEWGHFGEWKKINSEGEEGVVSLETALRGICEPERLLDLVENFTLFSEAQGGLKKLVAKNHQFLGVNNVVQAVRDIAENQGRLGVFWHTQGSGKSYSMVFFSQKVLRKLPGNWTFVIVTDRKELDEQIYQNFAHVGVVTEPPDRVRAQSGEHLKQLLREDHRFVFTLIQKFHTERGEVYPTLSERADIIVVTDEAHRSQYDVLALNMRNALPNAAFIGFTGTPLMAGEERTKEVFGDYVSIYNFKQSVDDGATVPLYYENRVPELQLTNPDLNADMERLLEDAELDEDQERAVEREFAREYHLITRDDRLETVAEDIVLHFVRRGYRGKAMVVSIDKATAVRTYDKVRKYWNQHVAYLLGELQTADPNDQPEIAANLDFMRETDMAVVVSQSQNEVEDLAAKGADIQPHRLRMIDEDLATKFKDEDDPLRLVFVCAMWMTGFDVPSCSTIYLDKPMRNHTLMQTIARANRVFGEKVNGLIVDYINVFRDLQQALAVYGSASGGGVKEGELPVEEKRALVEALGEAIESAREHLQAHGVALDAIQAASGLERIRRLDDAIEALIVNDDAKRQYLTLAGRVDALFKAVLPDKAANIYGPNRKAIVVLADKMRALVEPADISSVMQDVEQLLDESIAPKGYEIRDTGRVDLAAIDFEALKAKFAESRKRTEAEKLRALINGRLRVLVRLNQSRMDFYERFQQLIDEYNAGATNVDAFFAQLVAFAQELNQEEQRGLAEGLSEEELAVFDLLTHPGPKLSKQERERVKVVARDLLYTLKGDRLVLDWRKRQQSRAAVRVEIEKRLDTLPQAYATDVYNEKCEAVYQHVYDAYYGAEQSVYTRAA